MNQEQEIASIKELQATNAALMASVDTLIHAVKTLCIQHGGRLNRQQLADRLGVHRNHIATLLSRDRSMPRPGEDGKWMLAEIIDWELRTRRKRV